MKEPFRHIGVSEFRKMNATELREQTNIVIVHDGPEPIAVVLPFGVYMLLQEIVESVPAHKVKKILDADAARTA